MRGGDFTIGMLVAFQMFASRVSEPLLRLVGLWQQFQQATLSIARLGDIMNATPEPYLFVPANMAVVLNQISYNGQNVFQVAAQDGETASDVVDDFEEECLYRFRCSRNRIT